MTTATYTMAELADRIVEDSQRVKLCIHQELRDMTPKMSLNTAHIMLTIPLKILDNQAGPYLIYELTTDDLLKISEAINMHLQMEANDRA